MCFWAVSHVYTGVLDLCIHVLLSPTKVVSVSFVYSFNSSSVALHVQSYM